MADRYKGRKNIQEPPESIPKEEMGLWDLIKAGAIVMAIVLIAKIGLDLLYALAGFIRRGIGKAWGIFKANVILFVAIPLALAFIASLFPGSAEMMDDFAGWVVERSGLSGLELPSVTAPPRIDVPNLPLAPDLKDCTLSLNYMSVEEDQGEKRCMELCRDRGYESYGTERNGNSYDCYCCHGAGKPVE